FVRLNVPGAAFAFGINNQGQIVGGWQAVCGGGASHGFVLLNNAVYTQIDHPLAGPDCGTDAYGINDLGQVVGNYYTAGCQQHGYLLANGHFTPIDHPNAIATAVFGINVSGQIVGTWVDVNGVAHGYVASPTHSYTATIQQPIN